VVIGPNGTGKSTILCGVCLALGWDNRILGRSTEIKDYIKHGQPDGSVEVEM
jgi:structural maintenance of chromosomes protein 5